jgi:KTSC domain-containing protein
MGRSSPERRRSVRIPRIESEALNGASYDAVHRVLTIEFESGSVYQYFDIEPELFAALEAAQPHPWRVVGARVKEHRYRRLR